MESEQALHRNRFHAIGRVISMSIIVLTIVVIVVAFVRSRRQTRPPGPLRSATAMKANVVSIVEGYKTVRTENGRETLRLKAARDIAYSDGHHELEEVDLTAYGSPLAGQPPKTTRIVARRGTYLQSEGVANFEGAVTVTSSDGLVVETESLRYEQQTRIAASDVAVRFRQGEVQGAAQGARLSAATRHLELLRDVEVISRRSDPRRATTNAEPPLEIRSQSAAYDESSGLLQFNGPATVDQGARAARAQKISGQLDQATRRLTRIELRGDARLTSSASSQVLANEIDFLLDENEQLRSTLARGQVRASSIDAAGLPRSIEAPRVDVRYRIVGNRSLAQELTSQGRTITRFESRDGQGASAGVTERVVEAESIQALYREDGESFSQITARGEALLTITPRVVTPAADRKRLRADQFILYFAETGNRILRFQADGQVVGDFEPLAPGSRRPKKSLTGRKLNASFNEQTQDLVESIMEVGVRYTEADRTATASRATWTAATQLLTLRGRPQLWDSTARTDADEIDVRLETNESLLRGKVRTTWFSRESTGGAAPFRNRQAPVTVVADSAIVRHPLREANRAPVSGGKANYSGNVRAWQEDEFVRADQLELDRGERSLLAVGNAQSAYYQLEREVEKGRKQIVPVFASADRIRYNDGSRKTLYDGSVRIRQGTDTIDAATAEATMDEEHRLLEMIATGRVVMTQPDRVAKGERLLYNFKDEQARLTGRPATIEDRLQQVLTSSDQLTISMRDGRFEAADESGSRKRVRTTHRIK
ncbi:MAG: LPS export ABC transporter periplasmic protein LptC [Acidobacteriota bacterium]